MDKIIEKIKKIYKTLKPIHWIGIAIGVTWIIMGIYGMLSQAGKYNN